jgi:hypothetical protein
MQVVVYLNTLTPEQQVRGQGAHILVAEEAGCGSFFTTSPASRPVYNCPPLFHHAVVQGGTRFHDPLLGGLTVQPRQGDALIFFPAFADGRLDHRMQHSGLAVKEGEKWIINTWVCQFARKM